MGREGEDRVEARIWEGITNTEGLLKSLIEIYSCGSFLEYVDM